ncbi:hypothetical protein ACFQ6U_05865 [Streptomyces sp. NPDC056465]|uniref:hypothetical protein n=1 Tax=unclassified Streptomyces TaxID=2593676 RepID=UPI0035D909F4
MSLAQHSAIELPAEPWTAALPGPRSRELVEVRRQTPDDIAPAEAFQIGGAADEEVVHLDPVAVATVVDALKTGSWDGPVSADSADWVSRTGMPAGT